MEAARREQRPRQMILERLRHAEVRQEVAHRAQELRGQPRSGAEGALHEFLVVDQRHQPRQFDRQPVLRPRMMGKQAVRFSQHLFHGESGGGSVGDVPDIARLESVQEKPGQRIRGPVARDHVHQRPWFVGRLLQVAAGKQPEQLMHVVLLAHHAARVAHDRAEAGNRGRHRRGIAGHQRLGFILGLLIGVREAVSVGENGLGNRTGEAARHIDGADVEELDETLAIGRQPQQVFGAVEVGAPRFVQRRVEARVGRAVNDFSDAAPQRGGLPIAHAEQWEPDIALEDGETRAVELRGNTIGIAGQQIEARAGPGGGEPRKQLATHQARRASDQQSTQLYGPVGVNV